MTNINYGISPDEQVDDEMSTIMKDIEKNIEDEGLVDESAELPKDEVDEEVDNTNEEVEEEPIDEASLFREKYQLEKKKRKSVLADRQRLEQENYQLKNILDGTINNNAELYGRDLYNDLEKIKNIKKQAMLGDDPDLLIEADEVYQKTLYRVNEYENSMSKRSADNEVDNEVNQDEYLDQIKMTKAQEWIAEHPELIENSYSYDPKIQKELGSFIEEFDRELKVNGRENEILSDKYLSVLDEFVDNVKINKSSKGYTTSNVGGVRNNFQNGSSNSIKVTLTEFDKNYAKNLGISEKEYLKYKLEDMKESKIKGR